MFGKPSQFTVGLIGGMHNGGYTVGYCMPVHGVVMYKWVRVIVYICHMWGHNLSSNSKYSAYWHSAGFVHRFCCALHMKSTSQSNHCCLYRQVKLSQLTVVICPDPALQTPSTPPSHEKQGVVTTEWFLVVLSQQSWFWTSQWNSATSSKHVHKPMIGLTSCKHVINVCSRSILLTQHNQEITQ